MSEHYMDSDQLACILNTNMHSDQDLHCLLTDSLDTEKFLSDWLCLDGMDEQGHVS